MVCALNKTEDFQGLVLEPSTYLQMRTSQFLYRRSYVCNHAKDPGHLDVSGRPELNGASAQNLFTMRMPETKHLKAGTCPHSQLLWLAAFLFFSCASSPKDNLSAILRSSESCYTPIHVRTTPIDQALNAISEVPVLNTPPPRGRVLGTFKITGNHLVILKALQYNAHRVGADAIVIEKINWWDINNWEGPKTVNRTKSTPPSETEKDEYKENLKKYEEAKKQGKAAEKPAPPKYSTSDETIAVPGHWQVSGGAYLEAIFIETDPHRGSH